jgi:hypothetical protein
MFGVVLMHRRDSEWPSLHTNMKRRLDKKLWQEFNKILFLVLTFFLLIFAIQTISAGNNFTWGLVEGIDKCGPLPMEIFDHPGLDKFFNISEEFWLPDCKKVIYSVSGGGWVNIPKEESSGIWLYDSVSGQRERVLPFGEISKWIYPNKLVVQIDKTNYIYNWKNR